MSGAVWHALVVTGSVAGYATCRVQDVKFYVLKRVNPGTTQPRYYHGNTNESITGNFTGITVNPQNPLPGKCPPISARQTVKTFVKQKVKNFDRPSD